MEDDEEVTAMLEAQLVVLSVWPSDTWEDEEFVSASLRQTWKHLGAGRASTHNKQDPETVR